jgi:colanic acid/amylovoran biosynthesis protein
MCGWFFIYEQLIERCWVAGREITIGLLWHSLSSNNLGVGALTLSHLQLLSDECRKLGLEARFIVLGTAGQRPDYPENFSKNILSIEKLTRKKLLDRRSAVHRLLKQCDVVFDIGEGDSFSDIYGWRRYLVQVLSKFLCLTYRIPLVLAPQTIGPFEHVQNRLVAGFLMKRANKVFCRDRLSKDYAEQIGVKSVELATDVAFALPFESRKGWHQDGKIHVGMNVSGLLSRGGYTGANMFSLKMDYARLIERLIRYFLEQENCVLHLVSHVAFSMESGLWESPENDCSASCALKKKFPLLVVEEIPASPIQAKSLISGYDFFIGSRMHACIAAFSAGVPVIPVAYSRKFKGLFDSIGYPHVADCQEESEEAVFNKVTQGFHERARLKEQVDAGNLRAVQKLDHYRAEIAEMIRVLA